MQLIRILFQAFVVCFPCHVLIVLAMKKGYLSEMKCESFDEQYASFDHCTVTNLTSGEQEFDVLILMHQLPVKQLEARVSVSKKEDGEYKPYLWLWDISIDGCDFLKRSKNNFHRLLWMHVKPYININRGCPIKHDIHLKKARLNRSLLNKGLIPTGKYCAEIEFVFQNTHKIRSTVFFDYWNT